MTASIDDSPEAVTVRRLRRVMAVFTALLVASTWPLWIPGTGLPQIPWLSWIRGGDGSPGDVAFVGNLAVLLLLQFLNIRRRWLRNGLDFYFAITASIGLLFDQHRLQPWVLQMLAGGLLIGLSATPSLAIRRLRWFTISIYVWSAVSKLDFAFIDGHGQVLLEGLTRSIGMSAELWPESLRRLLSAGFPLGELLIAVLLMRSSTRSVGCWGAIVMHGMLILTLGPSGLGHEWGVLIWNAFFIVNAWLLFRSSGETSAADIERNRPHDPDEDPLVTPAAALAWIVCLVPALSLFGRWDWWPSWAVYSSRPAIVKAYVSQEDVARLPPSLKKYVGTPEPLTDRCPVNFDAWSYAVCRCPMYPQERYRLAVIAAVAEASGVEPRVVIRSTPDRWTGDRSEEQLTAAELRFRLETFWINTSPREPLRRPARD